MKKFLALLLVIAAFGVGLRFSPLQIFNRPAPLIEPDSDSIAQNPSQPPLLENSDFSDYAIGNNNELTAAEYILSGLENVEPAINLLSYKLQPSQLEELYNQLVRENPQLFFLGKTLSYTINEEQTVLTVRPEYKGSKEEISQLKIVFEREIERALAAIPLGIEDFEKVLAVNEYLVSHAAYDGGKSKFGAYDLFVDKVAVCQGYSEAFAILMDRLGIENSIVSSRQMEHAWNMVKLQDSWYHVDVTWNDPAPDVLGQVNHEYLLLSDRAISQAEPAHYGWEEDSPAALDDSFEEAFWRDIESEIIYHNGLWHYVYAENGQKHHIMTLNPISGEAKILHSFQTSWAASQETLWRRSAYLANYGGELYYNTADTIYALSFDGTTKRVVVQENLTGLDAIYEFCISKDMLYYRIGIAPGDIYIQKALALN